MGKSSNPVIGYQYGLGVHMGLCVGPVDQLTQIVAGGKVAWTGTVTASGAISINKPDLFGGQHKEGGLVGTATVMMGEPTQAPNAYLQAQLGTPVPAFRGLLTILYRGLVSAMSPYLKAWSFQVSKWVVGWRTPVWQPTLAKVNEGMNPAHILYRAVTDPVTGLGRDPSTLDLTRMLAAAQTLYNEGFGLNFKWSRSDVMANFVQMVCSHVGGDFVDDPTTGLQYLKLFRADYDINTATLIDEGNIIELQSFEVPALAGSVNEVIVSYHDATTNKDVNTPAVQNLANIQAQGRVVSRTNAYPGIGRGDLAIRAALRDLRAQSALPARAKAKVLGTLVVRKGDVLAFSWARLNVSRMAMRVLDIDRGGPTASAIVLTLAQNVYDVPSNAYVIAQPPRWTPPNTSPAPVPDQLLVEASYRDLAANMRAADLAQVAATAGYIGALGDMPPCVATGYKLQTSVDAGSTWQTPTSGPFAPSALLQASMVAEAGPSTATIINGALLDQVKVPCEVLIDSEIMRCDAINSTTGLLTLARGCVDTVPAAHTAGARVWFTDGFTAADPTEYLTGETVQAKLLTQTGSGTLDPTLAPTASVTLNSRQIRPYPPAGLKIGGVAYPAAVVEPMPAVTWAHRNRLTQADQLVDTTAANIGPESGVTYTMRSYLSGTLYNTQTGITGATATPTTPPGYGTVRVEVEADRGSYVGWQPLTATFDYRSAPKIVQDRIGFTTGVPGTLQLAVQSGAAPFTFTSTSLPAGVTMSSAGLISYDGTGGARGFVATGFTVTDANGSSSTKSIPIAVGVAHTARYWRITALTLPASGDGYTEIARLRMYSGNTQLDLTTSIATDSSHYTTRVAANMVKASEATTSNDTWTSNTGAAVPQWASFDLGAALTSDRFMMYGPGTYDPTTRYPTSFKVSTSADGLVWTDIATFTGTSSPSGAPQYYVLLT